MRHWATPTACRGDPGASQPHSLLPTPAHGKGSGPESNVAAKVTEHRALCPTQHLSCFPCSALWFARVGASPCSGLEWDSRVQQVSQLQGFSEPVRAPSQVGGWPFPTGLALQSFGRAFHETSTLAWLLQTWSCTSSITFSGNSQKCIIRDPPRAASGSAS